MSGEYTPKFSDKFPRGPGPLVSVLIPTRGRPKHLCQAVDSIYSLAVDKANIEFLFKVDDDDFITIQTVDKILTYVHGKRIISPRGNGYKDMHLWVNELAKLAIGDWLFLFNDDATMATEKWDTFLTGACVKGWHGVHDIVSLFIPTKGIDDNGQLSEQFMFLRRKVVEIVGHYSLIPQNDTWVKTMMRMVNSQFFFPYVTVEHDVAELNDEVRNARPTDKETAAYTIHSKGMNLLKLHDAIKLQQYIDKCLEAV